MGTETKRFFMILVVITLIGAALRIYGIPEQPPLNDEVEMAFTAMNYMDRGHFVPTMSHHPNLRNILIALSMQIFGTGSLGIRAFSLIFGTLSIPVLGMLMRRVTHRTVAASLAAFFLAVDPLHITFSRQAIQETHVVFFTLLGMYVCLIFLDRHKAGGQNKVDLLLLPLAGLIFGLGIASKYQVVFPLLICLFLIVYRGLHSRDGGMAVLAFLSFTILPLIVLMLTDSMWFARGYGLGDWLFMRKAVFERMSTKYVPALMEKNPDRYAWEWFVNPLLGYASFSVSEGKNIVAVGKANPLVWLLVLPASFYLVRKAELRKQSIFLQAVFWISYLPFIATRRPIYFLTALAVAPFAFGLVAIAVEALAWQTHRMALFVYIVAVLVMSVLLFPLCAGKALDYGYTVALVGRFSPH